MQRDSHPLKHFPSLSPSLPFSNFPPYLSQRQFPVGSELHYPQCFLVLRQEGTEVKIWGLLRTHFSDQDNSFMQREGKDQSPPRWGEGSAAKGQLQSTARRRCSQHLPAPLTPSRSRVGVTGRGPRSQTLKEEQHPMP